MFLVDNRFQNLGRVNLGWSAKHMGDSICFRADILSRYGWGQGLTDDYQLRQLLLADGIKIRYEPRAIGYGEAPLTWAQARAQRARWLKGVSDANRSTSERLWEALQKRFDFALLDGILQATLPSYSSLTLVSASIFLIQVGIAVLWPAILSPILLACWGLLVSLMFVYPLLGLALERAPLRAYLAILSGPVFILWRTGLAITTRFGRKSTTWVRTAHGGPSTK
jgi:cellulose synthase/poly-beta-1,6-N-acetylglucosamine synthase-like glycosyltransferase